jgi:hypothetical protein
MPPRARPALIWPSPISAGTALSGVDSIQVRAAAALARPLQALGVQASLRSCA